VNKESIKNS